MNYNDLVPQPPSRCNFFLSPFFSLFSAVNAFVAATMNDYDWQGYVRYDYDRYL